MILKSHDNRPGDLTPSLGSFFGAWFVLSLQSFGGGPATLTLIRRAMVERHAWVHEDEFSRYWALVQVAPGINLLALTILIGRRVKGMAGIVAALLGLLLPSVTLTMLITIYYTQIRHATIVQATLGGVLPATVGLGLLTATDMARPLLAAGRREGKGSLLLCIALLAGSGLAVAVWHCPVMLVLLAAGLIGAMATLSLQRPSHDRNVSPLACQDTPAESQEQNRQEQNGDIGI